MANLLFIKITICLFCLLGFLPNLLAEQLTFDNGRAKETIEAIRTKHKLPALGAAIVTLEGAQHVITTGTRRRGHKTPVTDGDLWHLGSCGKAMTATMIARLVEQGKLKFDQTLGETFLDVADKMNDQLKQVTLRHLLSHRSGLSANYLLFNYLNEKDQREARRKTLLEAMEKPLLSKPGDNYLYSNWGYTLAGHIAEEASDKDWETLMQREVFQPLAMQSAGFGGTGTKGKIDQPWPHNMLGIPSLTNGPAKDNLPVMGPAGRIHMSLEDWGKFIAEHLKGAAGKSDYLTAESFKTLHTSLGDSYAMGWIITERPWADGTAITHSGDNTMNHAVVWMAPKKGFAVLVVTNQSRTGKATDAAAWAMIRAWLGDQQ